jgi:hypothetical protein
MVTVPARARSGDLVVIEVAVEVGAAKSLAATLDDLAKQHAQADIPKQRFIHQVHTYMYLCYL